MWNSFYIILYFSLWMITWPAYLADIQAISSARTASEKFRSDLGVYMFFSLLPPAIILTPFLTGFYEHGFQFGRTRPMDKKIK